VARADAPPVAQRALLTEALWLQCQIAAQRFFSTVWNVIGGLENLAGSGEILRSQANKIDVHTKLLSVFPRHLLQKSLERLGRAPEEFWPAETAIAFPTGEVWLKREEAIVTVLA
jgi:hypothetical protein